MRNPARAGSRAGPGQHKEGEADSTASAAPLQVQPLPPPLRPPGRRSDAAVSAMPALPSGAAVMSSPIGDHALCRMAKELGRPQGTLTVSAMAPTRSGARHAETYLARGVVRRALARAYDFYGGHLRRLHYRLVSQASPIAMVGGGIYENTINYWSLLKCAGKWARYLGLIDADLIDDRRNPTPHLHLVDGLDLEQPTIAVRTPEYHSMHRPHIWPPQLPQLPKLILDRPFGRCRVPQLYHGEIWVEKSDVEDVVLPLCRRLRLELLSVCRTAGHSRLAAIWSIASERSDRPVPDPLHQRLRPAGRERCRSRSRARSSSSCAKRDLDLDIQVIPLALTKQQCIDLKLPRIADQGDGPRQANSFEARQPGAGSAPGRAGCARGAARQGRLRAS